MAAAVFGPWYPASAKIHLMKGKKRRVRRLRTSRAPSRSCIAAEWTTTFNSRPSVSTRICRLRPVTFLAASKPCGSSVEPLVRQYFGAKSQSCQTSGPHSRALGITSDVIGLASMPHKFPFISVGAIAGAGLIFLATQPHAAFVGSSAKAETSDTYRQLNLFGEVFERVRADYVEKPDDGKLIEFGDQGHACWPRSSFELHGSKWVCAR